MLGRYYFRLARYGPTVEKEKNGTKDYRKRNSKNNRGLELSGNLIPRNWYRKIKLANGKPNLNERILSFKEEGDKLSKKNKELKVEIMFKEEVKKLKLPEPTMFGEYYKVP